MSRVSFSHYERHQAYTTIRRIVDRLEADDHALALRAQSTLPDGFPRGGNSGGSSGGDHSDPTYSAVTVRVDGTDDASRAFGYVQAALLALGNADVHRRKALPPAPTKDQKSSTVPDDIWCASCARARNPDKTQQIFNPRSSRQSGRQDLCEWCKDEWEGSHTDPTKRSLPDLRLVRAHAQGVRLTEARRRELLSSKRKRAS